ncbi:UNVERIFIED_CONTAM: hypothetical protein FKN15_052949 [Acipenser sinensis]
MLLKAARRAPAQPPQQREPAPPQPPSEWPASAPSPLPPPQSPARKAEPHQSPAREAEPHQSPAKGGDYTLLPPPSPGDYTLLPPSSPGDYTLLPPPPQGVRWPEPQKGELSATKKGEEVWRPPTPAAVSLQEFLWPEPHRRELPATKKGGEVRRPASPTAISLQEWTSMLSAVPLPAGVLTALQAMGPLKPPFPARDFVHSNLLLTWHNHELTEFVKYKIK